MADSEEKESKIEYEQSEIDTVRTSIVKNIKYSVSAPTSAEAKELFKWLSENVPQTKDKNS